MQARDMVKNVTYDELKVGDTASLERTCSIQDIYLFAHVSGNTNPIHMEYLIGVLPVLRRFDHLVLSHELKKMKPDPAIFAHVLRLAGSDPARTAFFDDLPHFVEAAKRVGIRAFLFTGADEFAAQLGELGLR